MNGLLEGKSALVTGGASGIGRATALAFAREGARVLVSDLAEAGMQETVGLINAAGGQALSLVADVTREDDVAGMVAFAVTSFGRLDCAFNNAGIATGQAGTPGQRTAELALATWSQVIAVNLTGVFLCMKHEIAHMLQQEGGGTIVNTASIYGLVGAAGATAYAASKHGVVGATRAAALEYANEGIRINAVCPGFIETPMTKGMMERRGEQVLASVPNHRLGTAAEIAETVVFLCSERAAFTTGVAYAVDGGFTSM